MPEDQANFEECNSFGSASDDDNDELTDDDLVTLGLKVTDMERFDIERETCSQQFSKIWHEVHYKRMTGSICGRILFQKNSFLTCLLSVS